MNIKKLEKKRDTQFSVVTRVHDYVMLFEQESYDISEIEIREERLDKAALAYEELQLQLEEHVEDEETKAREELERTRFEVLFDKTKARIKRLKRLATSSNKLGEPEVRLPKMDLPHFNGEIHNWPNFKDLFEAVVHSNEKIPAIQKLMYLKSSLSGEASITIESIPATGSNYTVAWQALLDRFDNIQVLVNYHLKIICADANIKKKSALDLRKLLSDINQNVRALKALGQPTEYWDTILIHLICRRLDQDLRQEWFVQAREVVASKSVVPKLSQLLSFLEIQCNAMESAKSEEPMFKSKTGVALNPSKYTRITATTTATEKPKSECIICHQQHAEGLYKCAKFKGMSVPERIVAIKSTRVCFNCLNGGHRVSECTYKSFCKKCGQNHNTLIHYEKKGVSVNQETNAESTVVQSEQEVTVASVCALNTTSTVLLATALIKVKGADGVWVSCRALLDIASQTHLITKQLVDKLRLSNRPANVKIQGVNDLKANTDLEVSVTVRSRINKFQRTLECLIVPKLVEQLPQVLVDTASWGLPTNLPLADPEFWRPGEVDMLIGAELFMELLLDGQLRLPKNLPILQNSVLGWFESGRTAINQARDEPSAAVCLLLSRKPSEQNLSNLLEKFWSVEEVISNDAGWSQEARECEELFRTTTRQDENGRFIVRLPLKQDIHLGDSYEYARKKIFCVRKTFLSG